MNPPEVIAGQTLALISALVQIPVLIWHSKQKNVATLCLVGWFLIFNLHTFISGFVWSSDNIESWWNGDGTCDIMVRIQVGGHAGVVTATAALARNLSIIISDQGPTIDLNSFRARMFDLMLALTCPVLIMALLVISQQSRYMIFQYQGCTADLSAQWPTILICIVWPPIFAIVAVSYSLLALVRYIRKQNDVKNFLHCTNSGLTRSRFVRLLAFCVIVAGVMLPLTIYITVKDSSNIDTSQGYSWSRDHNSDWAIVHRFRAAGLFMDQWIYIILGLIQFACLGTGSELVETYRRVLRLDRRQEKKLLESSSFSSPRKSRGYGDTSPTTLAYSPSAHEFEMHVKLSKDDLP
ncbi:hypothetical protein TRICI_004016 [Trichomonascus ciferrii]|uniref:Uncharacterized protein n=1 Tax=Trichomonascus ciferrii TaxID=44093 RepID=A0A642V3D6_9ASCO|nr:hypothetical protein TRICI_004016 [Trichomonascus ciferrii]